MISPTMAPAKAKKKATPTNSKYYVMPLAFTEEEFRRLEAIEKKRGLRRTPLLKMLLKDEANRLNIP